MTALLEELWPAGPTEICKMILSYAYLIPNEIILETPVAPQTEDVHILNDDTIVVSNQVLGYSLFPPRYRIISKDGLVKKPLPNGELLYVHSGALFIRDGTLLHIAEANNKITTLDFPHPVEHIYTNGSVINAHSHTAAHPLPIKYKKRYDVMFNHIELGECVYYAPWSHCSIVDDRIIYMSVKIVDGLPQKTAVLASL